MEILKKFQSFILGAEHDNEDYVEDDSYYEEDYDDEDSSMRYGGRQERTSLASLRSRESYRKPSEQHSNVLTMPNAVSFDTNNLYICKPKTIEEAAAVCEQFKNSSVCIVTLEGLPHQEAQRIADLLSGACFVLDGAIERVTSNVFVMAPVGYNVSSELKDRIKKGDSLFSWMLPNGRN